MTERQDSFSWSAVPFGVASLLMFGLSHHEGRRVRQLKQVHPVSSVSEALSLSKLLPMLIAVRGKTGSVKPLQTQITSSPAVIIEDTSKSKAMKRNAFREWLPDSETFRRNRKESDWFITDDGNSRLAVESCANASHLEKTLVTSKRCTFREAHTRTTSKNGMNNRKLLGLWQTEKSLPVDTAVTIVGELAKSPKKDGTIVIREPSKDTKKAPFYITTQTFDELRRLFLRTSGTFKWMGVGFGAVSLVLMGINFWKHIRSSIRDRMIRKRIADERKRKEHIKNEKKRLSFLDPDTTHLGRCVVCCDNSVDAVFIPCGHLCACLMCCDRLKRCPICRSACDVHKVYTA